MGDVDRLAELWVDLARGQRAYQSHLLDEENYEAVREALARSVVTGEVLVARDATAGTARAPEVAGFVMFGIEAGAYSQDARRGVVHNLFVRPAYRDEGLGSRLLDAAESALVDRDAEVVSLEAMVANVDAIRFYERNGYRPHRVELEKRVVPEDATAGRASRRADDARGDGEPTVDADGEGRADVDADVDVDLDADGHGAADDDADGTEGAAGDADASPASDEVPRSDRHTRERG
jgi:ribosomal protein S18 acetylase RimI-like enzyme